MWRPLGHAAPVADLAANNATTTDAEQANTNSNSIASVNLNASSNANLNPNANGNLSYPIQWTVLFSALAALTVLFMVLLMRKLFPSKVISPKSSSASSSSSSSASYASSSYRRLLAKQHKLGQHPLASVAAPLQVQSPMRGPSSHLSAPNSANGEQSKLVSPLVDGRFAALTPPPHHTRFTCRSNERPTQSGRSARMLFVNSNGQHFWANPNSYERARKLASNKTTQSQNSTDTKLRPPNDSRNNESVHYYCNPVADTRPKGVPLCCDASDDFVDQSVGQKSPKVQSLHPNANSDHPNRWTTQTQGLSCAPEVAQNNSELDSECHLAAEMQTTARHKDINEFNEQSLSSSPASSTRSLRSTTAQILSSSNGPSFEQSQQSSDCVDIDKIDQLASNIVCKQNLSQVHQRKPSLSASFWSPNRTSVANSAAQLLTSDINNCGNTSTECSPMHFGSDLRPAPMTSDKLTIGHLSHANQTAQQRRSKFRALSSTRHQLDANLAPEQPSARDGELNADIGLTANVSHHQIESQHYDNVEHNDRQRHIQRHQSSKRFNMIRPQQQRTAEAVDKCDQCDTSGECQQHFYEEIQSSSSQ